MRESVLEGLCGRGQPMADSEVRALNGEHLKKVSLEQDGQPLSAEVGPVSEFRTVQ